MAEDSPESHQDPSPSPRDPRLEIPEVLRTPVPKSNFDPVTGSNGGKVRKGEGVDATGMARAWATAMDFVFTVVAGAGLGWGFDYWQKTLPWGTLVGLGVGFVGAFIRIVRATQRQERAERERRGK
jgi:hypothetical protein